MIKTAIPKRRYQLGEFIVTVLDEIESDDGIDYRYILATSREGEAQPMLFISAERSAQGLALRASMPDGSQLLGHDEGLKDIDRFTDTAIQLVIRMLDLQDEVPHRLM